MHQPDAALAHFRAGFEAYLPAGTAGLLVGKAGGAALKFFC